MADLADVTSDRDEREAPALIAASRKPTGPVANGHCHFCKEPVADSLRWCDTACRNDYEFEVARKARLGAT